MSEEDFGHHAAGSRGVFIDGWGAGPFVMYVNGKSFRFEDSDRFGPQMVNGDGSVRKNPFPSPRSVFWPAYKLWVSNGRPLEEDGLVCQLPDDYEVLD